MTGQDTDSVSTLGNPLSPGIVNQRFISALLEASGPSAGASVRSGNTLDSCVSAMESQMSTMEKNLKQDFKDTLDSFFTKFMETQNSPNPPGGASTGGING